MALQQDPLSEVTVNVLIVGAGPAGFMAAVTLARYGVSFRIIDQRPQRVQAGHAGGEQFLYYSWVSSSPLFLR